MDLRRLRMIEGLGVTRAAQLAAALELGSRMEIGRTESSEIISGTEDVINLFQPTMSKLPYEEFWVLYLTSANRIIDRVKVSQGGVSGTVVDHKLIVKRAVELLSPTIIVIHNHPSGSATPSSEDISLTTKLSAAAALFDIVLLDHIIITAGQCLSFRQQNLLDRI